MDDVYSLDPLLPPAAFQELDHPLAECVADEEVALGVAEPVVAVAGVGGFLGRASEVGGRDEQDVSAQLRPLCGGGLGLADGGHRALGVGPAVAQLADHHGQLGGLELLPHVADEVHQALGQLADDFPDYNDRGYEIAGFVWLQGWNDMFDEQARAEYEQNLVYLIRDVRKAMNRPKLPAVIGELGNGGEKAGGNMLAIRRAQAAAAARPEFKGTVQFVKTTDFARPAEDSPNKGHGHHWFGNAESYFLIGDALGEGMLELLGN